MPQPPALTFGRRLGLAMKAFRAMMFAPHSGAAYSYGSEWGGRGYGGGGGGVDWLAGALGSSGYGVGAGAGPFHQNPTVAACLRVIEDNAPQPVMQVVETQEDGDEVPVKKSAVLDLFRHPNPYYDYYTLAASLYSSLVVDGNAYLIKVKSPAGIPVELWWVPSWMMVPRWPVGDPSIFIDHYEYRPGNGVYYNLDVKDVIHCRYAKIDERNDRLSISPLKAAGRPIVNSLNEVDNFTATLMRHGGVPPIVIRPTVGGRPISPDEASAMTADYRTLLDGDRKGDPFIATGPFEVVPLGFSPEQLAMDKIPARLEDQICSLTGVPAMLAGLTSGAQHKTYANVYESRRSFYEETLIPLQARVAQAIDAQLLGDPGMGDPKAQRVRFSYTGIRCMEEDADKVATRAQGLWSAGVITREDAKKMVGIASDDNDKLYVVGRGQQFLRVGEQVPPFMAVMPSPGNPNLPPGSGGGVAPPTADGAGSGGGSEAAKAMEFMLLGANELPMLTAADELKNCGTGHGGFREGNTCQPHAGGGHGGGGGAPKPAGAGGAAPAANPNTAVTGGTEIEHGPVTVGGTAYSQPMVAMLQKGTADIGGSFKNPEDWGLVFRTPGNAKEAARAEKLAGGNKAIASNVVTPKATVVKDGSRTDFTLAGRVDATVRPSKDGKWISIIEPSSSYKRGGKKFDAEAAALAHSQAYITKQTKIVVRDNASHQVIPGSGVPQYIAAQKQMALGTLSADKWSVRIHVVVPAAPAKSIEREDDGGPFSLKAADAGDDETAARQLLAEARAAAGPDASPHDVLQALATLAEARMRDDAQALLGDLSGEAKGLAGDAAAKVKGWKENAGKFLRRVFLAAALALTDPMTPKDVQHLDDAVEVQMEYLDKFATQVVDGQQHLDGTVVARAGLYGSSAWSVAEGVAKSHAVDNGAKEALRTLGVTEQHCDECPAEADKGWQPIDEALPIGSTPCGVRCRCELSFR